MIMIMPNTLGYTIVYGNHMELFERGVVLILLFDLPRL